MSADYVFINEVGPRDGLQNQKTILTASARLELIKKLVDADFPENLHQLIFLLILSGRMQ